MQQRFGPRQRQACGECGRPDHDDVDDHHDEDLCDTGDEDKDEDGGDDLGDEHA